MYEDIKITDQIYASILNEEDAKRIAGLSNAPVRRQYNELVAQFHNLDNNQLAQALLAITDRLARLNELYNLQLSTGLALRCACSISTSAIWAL